MGFTATQTTKDTTPQMLLLAYVETVTQKKINELSKAKLDAFILRSSKKDLAPSVNHLKTKVWGVAISEPTSQQLETCKVNGSDFIIYGIDNTPADLIEEEEIARVLCVSQFLEETTIRALEDLPFDIVLLQGPESSRPLMLTDLVNISSIRNSVSRYLLIEWTGDLTIRELNHLRDIGVDGIVLDSSSVNTETFKAVRKKINSMPKKKPRGDQRSSAIIPRLDLVHDEFFDEDDDDL
jgi:hypothetical protein